MVWDNRKASKFVSQIMTNGRNCGKIEIPAYVHPFIVCRLLGTWGLEESDVLNASLLHDIVEDVENCTYEMIEENFGPKVAELVRELTFEFAADPSTYKSKAKAEYLASFATKSSRALLIKVADRICNVRDFYDDQDPYAAKYYRKADTLFEAFRARKQELSEIKSVDIALIEKSIMEVERLLFPNM